MNRRNVPTILVLCSLVVGGCATAPPRLPSSSHDVTGIPPFDAVAAELIADFEKACPPIVTARALVRGRVDRRRIDASFWFGMDTLIRPGFAHRLRLESMDTGPSGLALLATYSLTPNTKDEATLLLSDERWVTRSRSRELIELVLGVPLSSLELRSVLTGCPAFTHGDSKMERFDDATIKLVEQSGDAVLDVFIRRDVILSRWAVFAVVGSVPGRPIRWRVDAGKRSHGVLESIRLTSLESNGRTGRQFDLTVSFDSIQTPPFGSDLLSLSIPASAETIAIDAARSHISTSLLD